MKGLLNLKTFLENSNKLLALLMAVLMISLVGCGSEKSPKNEKKSKATSSNSVSEDTNKDDVGGDSLDDNDSNSDGNNSSKVSDDPLKGNISYNVSKDSVKPRDDANEIRYTENPAGLSCGLTGKYENEANTLREKILNSGNTADIYKIKGTKYYISPNGNDDNDGKSPEKPLRTINSLGYIDLEKGDAVLFERGGIFRIDQSIDAVSGITYGAYGKGDKPKIYASPSNYAQVKWTPAKRKNVWKATFLFSSACSIYFDNGKQIGYLKPSLRSLSENTQFYFDPTSSTIYLYCDKGNPAKVYKTIEICPDTKIIVVNRYAKNVTIDNLCLRYSGSYGIRIDGYNDSINISNCEIGFIGGTNNGTVRLGNAIESWTHITNFNVSNNYIYQTFDTAVTWQGQDSNDGKGIKYNNISFTNNLFEYNNADFEFWHTGAEVDNFVIENNICRFTSLGWGTRANDGGYRGIEGFIYAKTHNMTIKDKIVVQNNIIDCPGRQIINWKINPDEYSSKYSIKGNKIFVNESYRTTNEVVREFRSKSTDAEMLFASDLTNLKTSLSRFDKTAIINWVKK